MFLILIVIAFKYKFSYQLNGLSSSFQKSIKRYNKYKSLIYSNNINKCIRKKKAIVVLLNEKEVITFIEKNYFFLNLGHYDRLILFNTEVSRKGNYKNVTFKLVNIDNLWKSYPPEFNFSIKNKVKRKRSEWGYQHMIRFYFKNIFLHEAMCNVKWYMRLNSDSIFNSTYNPFDIVNDTLVYVYNNFYPSRNYDIKSLTVGMNEF